MATGLLCFLAHLLLLLLLLFHPLHLVKLMSAARTPAPPSEPTNPAFFTGKLALKVGLRFSVRAFFNENGNPLSIFSALIRALDGALFLPILSSPSFNTSNSSQSPAFSLGFLFSQAPSSPSKQNIYLAVCGGHSGTYPYSDQANITLLEGITDSDSQPLYLPVVMDGYVVPTWIANPTYPLRSVNASLVVVAGPNDSKHLQLRDYNDDVVWNVSNVGLMEMQDWGRLVIYDSLERGAVVWKSVSDTLFQGQKLTVGNEIMSNDSTYSARMEKGGLVLYLNTLQFMNERPAPFWVIPIHIFDGIDFLNVSKQVVSGSPCSPNDSAYAFLSVFFNFSLVAPCNKGYMMIIGDNWIDPDTSAAGPLSFMKLETDGWFHNYAVPLNLSYASATSLTSWNRYETQIVERYTLEDVQILQEFLWDKCSIPDFCGPLGICSPFTASPCTCPPHLMDQVSIFNPVNVNTPHEGCTRLDRLPQCDESGKDSHANSTDFIQLNHTASIFLFSGWEFDAVLKKAEDCKVLCSANCSCSGFFYEVKNSACFYITDEMSLLNLTDQEWVGFYSLVHIKASNYITYLKVTVHQKNLTPSNRSRRTVTFIAIGSSFMACVVLGLTVYTIHAKASKHKWVKDQVKQFAKEEDELRDILPLLPSRFSYAELRQATEGFSKLLGAGGCGLVHAGTLTDGRRVAVKTLEPTMKSQSKQFLAEVATIGRTSHHNIVRLVGFCWEVSSRMLVYEYMEGGSLDRWLFQEAGGPLLHWQTRYDVALGIARGLTYLHEECIEPILHFDIKPQNILLDGAFVAKLADFGMSRLMQRNVSEVVTGVRGTPGYIAPEWVLRGAVSKKCDVYSMGMVMLELVGGRQNIDIEMLNNEAMQQASCRGYEKWHFPSLAARKYEQGMLLDLVDTRLEGAFDEEEVKRLLYTAFWCIQEEPGTRPSAATVVRWLDGSCSMQQPPFSLCKASQPLSISSFVTP